MDEKSKATIERMLMEEQYPLQIKKQTNEDLSVDCID
jgi:hypothetical protein